MKTTFLVLTLATAAHAKQFDKCWSDGECGQGFYCRPANDMTYNMCQPGSRPANDPLPVPKPNDPNLNGQFKPCNYDAQCEWGQICKRTDQPVNGQYFSMCQPKPRASMHVEANQQCAWAESQCDGQNWPYGKCCIDSNYECKPIAGVQYLSRCLRKTPKMAAASDAVGLWDKCNGNDFAQPKACPAGSSCVRESDYYSQCRPNGTGSNEIPTWGRCGGTKEGYVEEGKKCRAEDFCKWYSPETSQCEPIKKAMAMHAAEAGLWQQCGGNGFNGDASCPQGSSCVRESDYYSQCRPNGTGSNEIPTWGRCGGTKEGYVEQGKKCRSEDFCKWYSSETSQCEPRTKN